MVDVMSNAKIVSMIADANNRLIEDVSRLLTPLSEEIAELRCELDDLKNAITPMALELDRLRDLLSQGSGVPP